MRTHQVRAIRTAYLITREVALAQDVVQAAFLRAFERIDQLDPSRPFAPGFLTSVLHGAVKAVSRRDRHTRMEVRDAQGVVVDRSEVTRVEHNVSIADATFAYTPPPGVAAARSSARRESSPRLARRSR